MGTTTLTDTKLHVGIEAVLSSSGDLGRSEARFSWQRAISYGYGAGADQVNLKYSDKSTIAGSGADLIDLAGSLADLLGNGVVFARVKAVGIYADPANAANILLGGATANGWAGPFGSTAHTLAAEPGGVIEFATRTAAGWAVAAGTGDIMRIANGGTAPATYEVVILGASS